MCNAWNHPPGCTCGWGGDGHLGKRTDGNTFLNGLRLFDTRRFDSYVNPNAKCPVCGAAVYFYKSEHGGRVFFDDLGPPWPKHPCTDNSKYSYQIPFPTTQNFIRQTAWQKNGWFPVTVDNLSHKSAYAFTITRIDSYFASKIDTMIYGSYAEELTKTDLIIFAKRKDKVSFTLAVFDVNDNITFEVEINHSETKLDTFFSNHHTSSFRWL
ncbi:MAG: hypothetical protein JSR97_02380 [Verrucomicrobia bacterium]|nr:hypothetical protein [Verrucomicrobiota bacterium]